MKTLNRVMKFKIIKKVEEGFTGAGSITAPSTTPQNPLQAVGSDGEPTIGLTPEMKKTKKKLERKKQIKTVMARRVLPKI